MRDLLKEGSDIDQWKYYECSGQVGGIDCLGELWQRDDGSVFGSMGTGNQAEDGTWFGSINDNDWYLGTRISSGRYAKKASRFLVRV